MKPAAETMNGSNRDSGIDGLLRLEKIVRFSFIIKTKRGFFGNPVKHQERFLVGRGNGCVLRLFLTGIMQFLGGKDGVEGRGDDLVYGMLFHMN